MPSFLINLRLFWDGARLSYIALFSWLTPSAYIGSKIIVPMAQLVFFTYLGMYATGKETSSFYVIGNAIHGVAMSAVYGVPISIGEDRALGTLPYLFGSPSSRLFIFMGRAFFHVLDGMLGVVCYLGLGIFLFGLDISQTNVVALVLAILCTTLSTCGFGLMLGSISLITVNALFLGNTFYYILLVMTGVNIPVAMLPQILQFIAALLPITRGLQATRQIITGAHLGHVSTLLVGELLIGLVYITIGYLLFRIVESQARQRGTLETV